MKDWQTLQLACGVSAAQLTHGDTVAFMHERASPDGKRWLVIVEFPPLDRIAWKTLSPPAWDSAPQPGAEGMFDMWPRFPELEDTTLSDFSSRFLAGQPDPVDRSRFTLPFQIGEYRGAVEGWVLNGGKVDFTIRDRGRVRTIVGGPVLPPDYLQQLKEQLGDRGN